MPRLPYIALLFVVPLWFTACSLEDAPKTTNGVKTQLEVLGNSAIAQKAQISAKSEEAKETIIKFGESAQDAGSVVKNKLTSLGDAAVEASDKFESLAAVRSKK